MLQIGLAQFEGQRTQSRMKDDNTTLETTPTPNNRRLSHGLKSLVALCLLGSASAVVGLVSVNPSQSPVTIEQGEFVPPSPALAATLVSATDVEPLQFDVERVSGKLKSRETLTDLVTRLGADTAEAARALHTLYDGELLNPRKLRRVCRLKRSSKMEICAPCPFAPTANAPCSSRRPFMATGPQPS